MATFTYTARAFNGDLRTATIDAASRDDVIAQLRKQRLSVVKIDQDAAKKIGRGSIKTRDVVIFTRQFSTMINSGLPLVQALKILAAPTDNKALAEVPRKGVSRAVMFVRAALGCVFRRAGLSRFTRTLGTLISSGVSILEGLEITAKTAGNRVIQDAIMQSRSSIAGGDTIAQPLQKSKVFPPMVISMIAVGEQTGGLD